MNADNTDAANKIQLHIKFKGEQIDLMVYPSETLGGVKRLLESRTNVLEKKQKLLGLKTSNGRLPTDDCAVGDLKSIPRQILMLGTAEQDLKAITAHEECINPHIQEHEEEDDGDMGHEQAESTTKTLLHRPEIQEKLRRRMTSAVIKELNAPRKGKKCVVFDIDYTFFDLSSTAETPRELLRPYFHHLCETIYPHYDIVIWSATSMKWIDVKLKELGVTSHPGYKITATMDYTSMVTVAAPGYSKAPVFDCKPLQVLWNRYLEYYGEENTVMVDDLRRNFILNPQNGLVIHPFRKSVTSGQKDTKLLKMLLYFQKISQLESFKELDHDRWELYVKEEWKELKLKSKQNP